MLDQNMSVSFLIVSLFTLQNDYFCTQPQTDLVLLLCSTCCLCALQASDGFTGFIKVHLRLSRPVTVAAVEPTRSEGASRLTGSGQSRSPSGAEDQEGTDGAQSEKKSSFYLPCDCVKQIHISSLTTTGEVIQGLLKKYMVLDNPRKFALYRQTHRDGQGREGQMTTPAHHQHGCKKDRGD